MAKNSKENKSKKQNTVEKNPSQNFKKNRLKLGIKEETKHGIYTVISFVLGLFFVLAAFRVGGPAGEFFYKIFSSLFGIGYFLIPVIFFLLGTSFIQSTRPGVGRSHTISSLLFLFSGLGLLDISFGTNASGVVGKIVAYPFVKLFDVYASIIFLGAIFIISLLVMFDVKPQLIPVFKKFINLFRKKERLEEDEEQELVEDEKAIEILEKEVEEEESTADKIKKALGIEKKDMEEELDIPKSRSYRSKYVPPPLSLLEGDKGKPNVGDIKANSNIIKRTLQNFGILVEMDEITIGPSITRYALKPAEGVKLSRIVTLQNDLSLALAAHPIRIEAPIPGKSLVGVEIPNKVKSIVGLSSIVSDERFISSIKPLTVALGRGISGKSIYGNLSKMPHLLIAGATGSGKSVTIHSIITSLLYRNGPEEMKFIMVDPKRVELTLYNKIPHLLTPVITDPKKAILALKWAAKEMSRRYDILESESVRDIDSYHSTILRNGAKDDDSIEKMPYIVVVIDELADIMQAYPRELESAIIRLAQMSRAVGIHLIISTQRPSVNVITGLIKANIPARIALQVSSQIDSRTILDTGGAEKLLGAGDMLYLSGEMSQPERLQSAFISEDEVKKVVKYLSNSYRDEVPSDINLSGTISPDRSIFESSMEDDASGDDDEMYEEARSVVIEAGKASTSYLQRKLKVGYARAARLIDMLEERGIVGPGDGAKPREVMEKPLEVEKQDFNQF
ncbi:MAG: DNA translocase FtsK 4TM domain-containing protein [Candidatus Paceibacterota bacterium]|jgi:S-DNA-T family DNA segregation ATPase FtsK/SpoIIIE